MQVEVGTVEVAPEVRLSVRSWSGRVTGAAFLLVHGLASNARMWDGVAAALAAQGHRVAAVDLRGHGLSEVPETGYDQAAAAEDLRAAVRALGLDRPVVAGQSWGGNVVLGLAARWPDLVRAVAAVDGGTIELRDRFTSWPSCAEALAPPKLDGLDAAALEQRVRVAHPDWPESGVRGLLACFRVRQDGTVEARLPRGRHLEILRDLWEHPASEAYPRVTVPVLLVPARSGEAGWTHDRRADVERALAALPDGRAAWLDGDHDLHAQHPQQVADLLLGLAYGVQR